MGGVCQVVFEKKRFFLNFFQKFYYTKICLQDFAMSNFSMMNSMSEE